MKKIYTICEDLANFFYTNISLIYFNNFKTVDYLNFNVPTKFKLTSQNLIEMKDDLNLNKENAYMYIFNSDLRIGYFTLSHIKKNFFISIGPLLLEDKFINNAQQLYNLKKDNILYEFYLQLRKNKITSYSGLINIINGLINYNYKTINIIAKEFAFPSKKETVCKNLINDEIIKDEIIQERYLYENLILDNIKNGNSEKALYYSKKLHEHFDFGTRMPQNQFRAKKNGAFILAGMSRKVLEELNIPYFIIHFLSSKYFYQIEESHNLTELEKVNTSLIKEYSEICLNQKNNPHLNDIVNKATFYININLNKNIYIKDIANYCGVSLEHLSRTFKKQMNISLKKYIISLKIKESLEYLNNTNFSVKDIAIKLDFSSTEIFVKNFKTIIGITPTQYQKNKYNLLNKN